MKHTKGKWKALKAKLNPRDPMFYKADVICGGIRIAHVAGAGEEAANANAQLIATAPELLKACKMALKFLSAVTIGEYYLKSVITLLKQVIAKTEEGTCSDCNDRNCGECSVCKANYII